MQLFSTAGCSMKPRCRCKDHRVWFMGIVFFWGIFFDFWCRTEWVKKYHLYLLLGEEIGEVKLFYERSWGVEPLYDEGVFALRHCKLYYLYYIWYRSASKTDKVWCIIIKKKKFIRFSLFFNSKTFFDCIDV